MQKTKTNINPITITRAPETLEEDRQILITQPNFEAYIARAHEQNRTAEALEQFLGVVDRRTILEDSIGITVEEHVERLVSNIETSTETMNQNIEVPLANIEQGVVQIERALETRNSGIISTLMRFHEYIHSHGALGYVGLGLVSVFGVYAGYLFLRRVRPTPPTQQNTIINGIEVVKMPNLFGRIMDVLTTKLKFKK